MVMIRGICLGGIHFVGNLIGFLKAPVEEQNLMLFFVWGILPSAFCFIFAISALALVGFWGGRRFFRLWLTITWMAFVIMSLHDIWHLILGFLHMDLSIFLRVLGPGPWSLFGSILFGLTAWKAQSQRRETS